VFLLQVIVNNKLVEIDRKSVLADILKKCKFSINSVVRVNDKILTLDDYNTYTLKDGDVIEILPLMTGG